MTIKTQQQQKLTAKQEAFAQKVASGGTPSAVYRDVYDAGNMSAKTVWEAACRLGRNSKVTARVAELQAETCERTQRTRAMAIHECLVVAEAAVEARHYGAAVSALCEANRIAGFHVHRVDISGTVAHRNERLAEYRTDDLRAWVQEQRALESQ
jgi:hypothetical protein